MPVSSKVRSAARRAARRAARTRRRGRKKRTTARQASKRAAKRRSRRGTSERQRDDAVLERSAAKIMRSILASMSKRQSLKRSLSGRGTRKKRRPRRKR